MFDTQLHFYHTHVNPIDKVEAFNNFFNSTFTLSDFKLPALDQIPTHTNQLSHISIDECDVFKHQPISVLPRLKAATTLVHLYKNSVQLHQLLQFNISLLSAFLSIVFHRNGKRTKSVPYLKRRLYSFIKLPSYFFVLLPC